MAGNVPNDRGQASVEFLGVLPILVVLVVAGWQAARIGQAWWLTRAAASAAARAEVVGRPPGKAARAALPASLERGLKVRKVGEGEIKVTVKLAPAFGVRLGSVSAVGHMESQR